MAGGDVHTVTIGTVATATVVTTIAIATPTHAADCLDISNTAPAALSGGSWISAFPLSLSRWHGITDNTTVGGDAHTVIAAATVTTATAITITVTADTATSVTTNRAAECCGVSGTVPGGAECGARARPIACPRKTPSRWHGVINSTTAGGDIGTVTDDTAAATVTIATPTRAADCLDISNTAPAALSGGS